MVGPQQQQEPRDLGKELLKEIKGRLPAKVTPEDAVRAVVCTFSQHVSGGDARHVFQLLPPSLHPLLERCMLHRAEPAEQFDRDQLVVRVADHLGISLDEAETAASAVLKAVSARLPRSDVKAVARQLPPDLRDLWIDEPVAEPHPLFLEIEQSIELPRGVNGQRAMMYVMCTFTRRLSKGEARRLADGLPHEVRPLLGPCLGARAEAAEHFSRRDLLDHISKDLHTSNPEPIVRGVLKVVKSYLRPEIIDHVKAQLPTDLKEIWHDPDGAPRISYH